MTIYRNKAFYQTFVLTDSVTKAPIDISSWTFSAQFRLNIEDNVSLIDVTVGNGLYFNTDGADGKLDLRLLQAATELMFTRLPHQPISPKSKFTVFFDLIRTDGEDVFQFRAQLPMETSYTRDI